MVTVYDAGDVLDLLPTSARSTLLGTTAGWIFKMMVSVALWACHLGAINVFAYGAMGVRAAYYAYSSLSGCNASCSWYCVCLVNVACIGAISVIGLSIRSVAWTALKSPALSDCSSQQAHTQQHCSLRRLPDIL